MNAAGPISPPSASRRVVVRRWWHPGEDGVVTDGPVGPAGLTRQDGAVPHLVPFVVVATLLTLTPGADTMVVLSHAARYDRHEAQQAVWGVVAGLAVWA